MVSTVQRRLTLAGFAVRRDGLYGPRTAAAVRRFQIARRLLADAIVGRQTAAALRHYSRRRGGAAGGAAPSTGLGSAARTSTRALGAIAASKGRLTFDARALDPDRILSARLRSGPRSWPIAAARLRSAARSGHVGVRLARRAGKRVAVVSAARAPRPARRAARATLRRSTLLVVSAAKRTPQPADRPPAAPGTAPPAADPSGEPTPLGDLPGWRQIFVDDFGRDVPLGSFPAAVSDKWSAYPAPWRDTSRNGWYDPRRVVSIGGGVMDMFIHTETIDGVTKHLVAAPEPRIPPSRFLAQTYGRYAMRFRADPLPGYKVAWLLWPTSGTWSRDGEIDFPEGDLDSRICAFMHRQNATSGSDQEAVCTSATFPTWHTAVIEWTPAVCRFILDGKVIMESTARIPSTPMRWVLQTETALHGGVPADSTAGHVQVDWVAAYAPA